MTMPSLLPIVAAHPPLTTRPSAADLSAPTIHHHAYLERFYPEPKINPGHPVLVRWHPTRPILCTVQDVCWWDTKGTLLVRPLRYGHGSWTQQGDVFWCTGSVRDDHTRGAVLYIDFRTNTHHTLAINHPTLFLVPHPDLPLACIELTAPQEPCRIGLIDIPHAMIQPLTGVGWENTHTGGVMRWSPDGRYLCGITRETPSSMAIVRLLSRTGEHLAAYPVSSALSLDITWSPDGRWIIVQTDDTLMWWEVASDRVRSMPLRGAPPSYEYLRWHPSGSVLTVVSDGNLLIFDAEGELIDTITDPEGHVIMNCIWHPISGDLITATRDARLLWWDQHGALLSSTKLRHPLFPQGGVGCTPFSMAWDATGTYLAAGLYDRTVQIYRLGEERAP